MHHDIVIIGRAAVAPLPGAFAPRLAPVLTRIGRLAQEFLRASAIALRRHSAPPPRDTLESALDDYLSGINIMRGEGLTITLSIEEAERIFAIGFALEQMRHNFVDLERGIREQA